MFNLSPEKPKNMTVNNWIEDKDDKQLNMLLAGIINMC